jgi:hypothetical protein
MTTIEIGLCGASANANIPADGNSLGPARFDQIAPNRFPATRAKTNAGASTQPCHSPGRHVAPTTSKKIK